MRTASAGFFYFLLVFAAGFILGPIRVFWLETLLGKTLAVLCETPFLMLAMYFAARFVSAKFAVNKSAGALLGIGLEALVLQQIADIAVGTQLRGFTVEEHFQQFTTPAGAIYAVALLVFAAMPLLANRARGRL